MRLRLDENLGRRLVKSLRAAGHDVDTVVEAGLSGLTDAHLLTVCCEHRRVLVTLDVGYTDMLRFPPERSCGVIVLRPESPVTPAGLERLLLRALPVLPQMPDETRLAIVGPHHVRVHQP